MIMGAQAAGLGGVDVHEHRPVGRADLLDVDRLEICPWALREGVILERLDQISIVSGRR